MKVMGKNKKAKSSGFVLVVTVGTLAVMTMLVIASSINSRLNLKDAENYTVSVKAQYMAEAGVNYAIRELITEALSNAVDTTTEDWYGADPYTKTITVTKMTDWSTGTFTVTKITDCASQIYVNDTNTNDRLQNLLNNLGTMIGISGGNCNGDEGTKIISNRPAGGYLTKEQLRTALTEAEYEAIKDYVTVFAFVDNDVIDPLDNEAAATPDPPYYESQPRAPINVNTASREVLAAALSGISAVVRDGASTTSTITFSISSAEAVSLADHLISGRPYATYDQLWARLLDADDNLALIEDGDAAIVMANANPNTDIMGANHNFPWPTSVHWSSTYALGPYYISNPNYTWRYKHVSKGERADDSGNEGFDHSNYDDFGVPIAIDKTMLTAHTTEFCFNSGGYYEIEVNSRVRNSSGAVVSEKDIIAVAKIFDIWRQTTQAQFYAGKAGSHEVSFYPECDQASSGVPAAAYDGQIGLETIRVTTPNSTTGDPHFRMNLGTSLNASGAGGDPKMYKSPFRVPRAINPNRRSIIAPIEHISYTVGPADVANSYYWGTFTDEVLPGNLMPDGLFAPRYGKVASWFYAQNNIDSADGTFEVWFKPNWCNKYASFVGYDSGKFFEAVTHDDPNNFSWWHNNSMDSFFARKDFAPNGYIWLRVRSHNPIPYPHPTVPSKLVVDNEYGYIDYWIPKDDYSWKPGTWHHLAVTWDYADFVGDPAIHLKKLYVDGVLKKSTSDPVNAPQPFIGNPSWSYNNAFGLYFGHDYGTRYYSMRNQPNSTYDEIRIFPTQKSAVNIANDYAEGRYYDGINGDAYFESTPNDIGTARLGTISWTEHTADTAGNPVVPGVDIQFDVFDGSNWIGNYGGRSNPAGNSLNLLTAGGIKYRAYFITAGTGLLDTPLLNDVTITYIKDIRVLYMRSM